MAMVSSFRRKVPHLQLPNELLSSGCCRTRVQDNHEVFCHSYFFAVMVIVIRRRQEKLTHRDSWQVSLLMQRYWLVFDMKMLPWSLPVRELSSGNDLFLPEEGLTYSIAKGSALFRVLPNSSKIIVKRFLSLYF